MVDVYTIASIISFSSLGFILLFTFLDYWKKKQIKSHPFFSFIIPCYNDGKDVEDTIVSLYKAYDKFELFVVNDKSKDNSLDVLKKLKKKYKFTLVNNECNLGKAASINKVSSLAKGDILFIIDADMVLRKENIEDIIKRFDSNDKIAAVSCPYRAKNNGFLARMQEVEYNFESLVQFSHNRFSTLAIWGGCFAVKREAFFKVGKLAENMLTEDLELASKLCKAGYKVEQSLVYISTDVPSTVKAWIKQKMRWIGGVVQVFFTYPETFLGHPVYMIFTLSYIFLGTLLLYSLLHGLSFLWGAYNLYDTVRDFGWGFFISVGYVLHIDGGVVLHNIFVRFALMPFSFPYVVMLIDSWKKIYKILYLIPFTLIYTPMFTIMGYYGFFYGLYKYFRLRNKPKTRAW